MGDSGPVSGVKAAIDEVKGKVKEAIGVVTDNDRLKREGEAQQDKGEAEREVAKREAEAEVARGKAKAAEAVEEANQ